MITKITLKQLSERSGLSETEVRDTLKYGWSCALLAFAGQVTPGCFRAAIARGRVPGASKFGREWIIPKEWGDAWLRRKKQIIIVEES